MNILLIALGGGLGAVSRYLLSLLVDKKCKHIKIPLAMLAVNIIGAGGLGLFIGYFYQTLSYNFYTCNIYLCFGVGFFGAYTTFSTFSLEAVGLLQKRDLANFSLYIFLSITGVLVAFSLGFLIM